MSDLHPIRGNARRVGRMCTSEEAILLAQSASPRDKALLALLLGAGLRRSEAAAIRIEDIREEEGGVLVLTVLGKGAKVREVALAGQATQSALDWARRRGEMVERTNLLGLSSEGVRKAFERLCKRAGVQNLRCHDLRRTFASRSLGAGIDVSTVQRALGHSDPRTTTAYDRRGRDALIEAARRVADAEDRETWRKEEPKAWQQ